jgi:hypothetical protein
MYIEVTSGLGFYDYSGSIRVEYTHWDWFVLNFCIIALDLNDSTDIPGGGALTDLFIHNIGASTDGPAVHPGLSGFGTSCADSSMQATIWYTWTATVDGWATVSTCDPDGWDGMIEIYEGTACPNVEPRWPIACDDDGCGREGSGVMPEVEFEVTTGSEWLIRLGSGDGSQGTSRMNIWESETARLRPANDRCADIASPGLLADGFEEVRYGDVSDGSNIDCLLLPPTVWEAFSLDFCADVRISYCPSENVTDPDPGRSFYSVPSVLFSACPCDASFIAAATEVTHAECIEGHRTEYYNAVIPGTYYIAILPGWTDGPFLDPPSTGEYGLSITASAIVGDCKCCVGRVGDANQSGDDEPTIADIAIIVDALFIGGDKSVLTCLAEADMNQSGGAYPVEDDITIADVSYLIDFLFITGPSLGLPDCL